MNLYSVLMVDDEDEVVQIIRRKINWEELGFQVCGQAKNGIEALEMAEELQPDVVMTDIKMPYMDGLELTSHLKKRFVGIRIIIFSGFDEFDYVKQAIGLEVEEYLLKPIDSAEIRRVFTKMKLSLDAERDMQSNIASLEKYYQNSLPLLRESFLSSLMEDAVAGDRLGGSLEEYHIELNGPCYVIGIIHTGTKNVPKGMSVRLLRLSVRQLVDQSGINRENSYIFNYRDNIVVLSQLERREDIAGYTDLCDRFCKTAKRSCQAVVTIGIGKVVEQIRDISSSYKGAREALSYRTLYGAGNAINIMEIDPKGSMADIQEKNDLHGIFKQVKMGTKADVELAVNRYMVSLRCANLNLQGFRLAMMELVTEYYRFLTNNEVEIRSIVGDNEDIYLKLLHMDSMDELQSWLLDFSLDIRERMQQQRNSKSGSFVKKAQNYVAEHYSNPELTIDLVCSELGVSSAYFSTIFKKETGRTFLNYLTEYRMKEAERLLIEQDEKLYIIAEKVGYSDPSYFSYVFKKWFGMSPVKYKNRGNKP